MPLLLSEKDVQGILNMALAMELVETSFRRLAEQSGQSQPRRRLPLKDKGTMHYMAACDLAGGYAGLKIYTVAQGKARFMVPLYSADSGELLALIEADYLGQQRTGAASGVATKFLARSDARVVGMIGTGLQACTQLEAVCHARQIEGIRVFGRNAERRERFAKEMTARLKVPVTPAGSAEETVRGAHIVITCTNSVTPVLEGAWLEKGMHVNAAGVNWAHKRELDTQAVQRANVIAADSIEQSKIESGDLIQAFGDDASQWNHVIELADIISGKKAGRTSPDQITLFKSNGIAMEDIVTAGRVYEIAQQKGIGRSVAMWGDSTAAGGAAIAKA